MLHHQGKNISLIGEIKICSPSGFASPYSWEELFERANASAAVDMIAVHTDNRWGGSFDLLKKASVQSDKPLLAKGIHTADEDLRRAFNCGADYALVVGRIPDLWLANFCYYEPLNLDQLRNIQPRPGSYRIRYVVWNARDLADPTRERYKTETLQEARALWPAPKTLIQASTIRSLADIAPEADSILVGSYLPEFLLALEVCREEDSNLRIH